MPELTILTPAELKHRFELANRCKNYSVGDEDEKHAAYGGAVEIFSDLLQRASQQTIEGVSFEHGTCNKPSCYFGHWYYDTYMAFFDDMEIRIAGPRLSFEAFQLFYGIADEVIRPGKIWQDKLSYEDLSDEIAVLNLSFPRKWMLGIDPKEREYMGEEQAMKQGPIAEFKAKFSGPAHEHLCGECLESSLAFG